MPADVEAALRKEGMAAAYAERPPYQRNDYIWWISEAKTDATRQKRISQMLRELKEGGIYMGMPHRPSRRKKGV